MYEEHHLIPYHTLDILPGKNWLVFAPHADDETFGMGGTLLLAKEQGINTSLVIMTNGILGLVDKEKSLTANIRYEEAKKAAHLLGMQNVTFLDEEDRGLSMNEAIIKKIHTLILQHQPDCIFIPAPLELHPDHRMTAFIVWQALQDIEQTPDIYAYEISVQGFINTLIDTTSVAQQKHQVMQIYQSQIQQNNYIEIVQALDKARTYTLENTVKSAEGFLKLDRTEHSLYPLLENYFMNPEQSYTSSINQLEQHIAQLKAEQQQLLQSSSWKITRPLRWLKYKLLDNRLFMLLLLIPLNSQALDLTLDKNFVTRPIMQTEIHSQNKTLLPGIFKDEQLDNISIKGQIFTEEIYEKPHRTYQDHSINYDSIDGAGISFKVKTEN